RNRDKRIMPNKESITPNKALFEDLFYKASAFLKLVRDDRHKLPVNPNLSPETRKILKDCEAAVDSLYRNIEVGGLSPSPIRRERIKRELRWLRVKQEPLFEWPVSRND